MKLHFHLQLENRQKAIFKSKKKKKRKNISWLETTFLHTIHVTCSTLASLWPDSRSPRAKEPFFLMCTNGLDWMWRAAAWLWLLCSALCHREWTQLFSGGKLILLCHVQQLPVSEANARLWPQWEWRLNDKILFGSVVFLQQGSNEDIFYTLTNMFGINVKEKTGNNENEHKNHRNIFILYWSGEPFFLFLFFLASGLICTFVSVMRPGSPQRVKRAVHCVLRNSSGNVSLGQLRMLQQNSSSTVGGTSVTWMGSLRPSCPSPSSF